MHVQEELLTSTLLLHVLHPEVLICLPCSALYSLAAAVDKCYSEAAYQWWPSIGYPSSAQVVLEYIAQSLCYAT